MPAIVTDLPICVETSPWPSIILGVALVTGSAALARSATSARRSRNGAPPVVASLIGAAVAFALGVALALQKLNWQLRLDANGIALKAPFDYVHSSETIAWPDITSIQVSHQGYRGPSYKLRITGKGGTEIVVVNADLLPQGLGTLLQTLLNERAPHALGAAGIATELEYARNNRAAYLAPRYKAQNSRGEVIQ